MADALAEQERWAQILRSGGAELSFETSREGARYQFDGTGAATRVVHSQRVLIQSTPSNPFPRVDSWNPPMEPVDPPRRYRGQVEPSTLAALTEALISDGFPRGEEEHGSLVPDERPLYLKLRYRDQTQTASAAVRSPYRRLERSLRAALEEIESSAELEKRGWRGWPWNWFRKGSR